MKGLRFGSVLAGNNNINNNHRKVRLSNRSSNLPGMTLSCAGAFAGNMQTYNHLYERLCGYDNLFLAFLKAKKRKAKKAYVLEFEKNLANNLYGLQWELLTSTYAPRPHTTFTVRDPKTRKISASHFRDRVVHHAVCNIIESIFEKRFIHDTFANRRGKGTSAALKRFSYFLCKVIGNGNMTFRERERESQIFTSIGLCP
ncbi:TPA: hypothetical protein HA231_02455 [Candidatus Woesearchaeota archaeon]|nr:hypothetical protein [Candidatus Woesearchaeota archaeon]